MRVGAIILAAGSGSRAGVTKQLLELRGKPLLQHAIDNVAASSVDTGVVVLGHDAEAVDAAIDPGDFTVVVNEAYASGQASSLIAGVWALPEWCDAAVVVLGDQPGVDAPVIDQVIDAATRSEAKITIAAWQGVRGNPVLFRASLFPEISSLTGDTGARAIFQRYPDEIETVEFGRPMPLDVDTLEDYRVVVDGG
ncbi:MAG: nucleotidyltransferase family protein [Thermomicrobiales bacterium]|nr:nucleotidyltransferase family protein [Thermomicrobiales bacterium]